MSNQLDKGKLGEDFIHQIAFDSFLKFWCYPNPKDEYGDQKEICDLLIVFNDTAIIVCVKNYEFKGTYNKYFRKTIEKDIRQLSGAERKLTDKKTSLFIKHPDKEIEEYKKNSIKKICRIIVHLGDNVRFYPLRGKTNNGKFVHIFDRETFRTIFSELDTIPDFIEYLEKKEEAFNNTFAVVLPKDEYDFDSMTADQFKEYSFLNSIDDVQKYVLISGTEFDLLAHYLVNNRQMPGHLISQKYGWLFLQIDGAWADFQKRKEVILKRDQDKISYFVDDFVRNELFKSPNEMRIKIARELLSFSRFDRRIISKSFFSFYNENKDKGTNAVSRRYWTQNEIGFAFVLFPPHWNDITINSILDLAVQSFCIYDKYKAKKIILIANRFDLQQFRFGMIENIIPFDKETEDLIMEDVKKLGWFTNINYSTGIESEYPG